MGLTFKENCPDTRNSKVFDVINQFQDKGVEVDVYDPWVLQKDIKFDDHINLVEYPKIDFYNCIILAVAHKDFINLGSSTIRSFGAKQSIIYDLKYMFTESETDIRL